MIIFNIILLLLLLIAVVMIIRITKNNKEMGQLAQQRMQAILDSAPMVCAIFDKNYNTVDVNKEVEHLFNIPDRKIYIEHFEDFLPKYQPDGAPSFEKSCDMIKIAFEKDSNRYE